MLPKFRCWLVKSGCAKIAPQHNVAALFSGARIGLDTADAVPNVGRVGRLAHFAIADDVDAGRDLRRDNLVDRLRRLGLERLRIDGRAALSPQNKVNQRLRTEAGCRNGLSGSARWKPSCGAPGGDDTERIERQLPGPRLFGPAEVPQRVNVRAASRPAHASACSNWTVTLPLAPKAGFRRRGPRLLKAP